MTGTAKTSVLPFRPGLPGCRYKTAHSLAFTFQYPMQPYEKQHFLTNLTHFNYSRGGFVGFFCNFGALLLTTVG